MKFLRKKMNVATFRVLIFTPIIWKIASATHENLTVHINQGIVRGFHARSYNGRLFTSFEGIPYAKPPTGRLRFKEPQPASSWNGSLEANKSYICPQLDETLTVIGTEDCLYINVHVPKTRINKNDNFDVVVHMYGGSLVIGSAYENSLPDYLMDKNLILVTFNYRLGAAGFLSTGDDVVSGNNGFKDQVLALEWIKDNIKHFGGNPNSVTITGFSSGGSSVHFHYISPLSKGLFHKGLSTSYTVLGSASLTLDPLKKAQTLANNLNCTMKNSRKMVDCLRKIPIEEIVKVDTIWFRPVVEKNTKTPFLPDIPYKLLRDGKINDVPWVTTNVINESLFSLESLYRNRSEIFSICANFTEWSKVMLDLEDYVDEDKLEFTSDKLKKFYLDDCNLNEENGLEKMNKLMTHRHFLMHSDLSLRTHSKGVKSPIFYYLFEFVPEDRLEFFGPPAASHGVDSKLMFKYRSNPDRLRGKGEKMMKLLVNFIEKYAKTGVPQIGDVKWEPIDPKGSSLKILNIKSINDIKMVELDELVPRKLWNSLPIMENMNLVKLRSVLS